MDIMIRQIFKMRTFLACVLAATTGMMLYFCYPFPDENFFLELIFLWARPVFQGLKFFYTLFLFTTPYILYSFLISATYIFTLKRPRRGEACSPPSDPPATTRKDLFALLGEVHNPRTPGPSEPPRWLTIRERGLFTGIAVFGAVGSGKTSTCLYPYAEQILSYEAANPEKRIGGLVLEVKGDFCREVRGILARAGRPDDYVEISLGSPYRYHPLHNGLDAYALAYSISALINNLFGRSKEPFWQQAYTNLVKFIILLHKVAYDYVTLFDVYECAISPEVLEKRIEEAEKKLSKFFVEVSPETYTAWVSDLKAFSFELDKPKSVYRAKAITELCDMLRNKKVPFQFNSDSARDRDFRKWEQLEAVKRWFHYDWKRIEPKLRTSIVEGISVFLSLFDDNPDVKRTFCPPAACYDPHANADFKFGKPLPSFSRLIDDGAVCGLNFPIGMNPGLAKAIGVMMKLDFERAVLNRVPVMEKNPESYFRQVLFLCDEYQHFATVGESEPTGDEKFFSLSRQPKCIPIIATQSISSLKSALPGESWRTLLQTFRTKIFLSLSDDFSARIASELCGREYKLKASYNLSESGHDASVSFLTGKALSHKANITASKSYSPHHDLRFDTKTFMELRNAQSITVAYDGTNPMPPTFCYLKPYYNDVNKSYFLQLADGEL